MKSLSHLNFKLKVQMMFADDEDDISAAQDINPAEEESLLMDTTNNTAATVVQQQVDSQRVDIFEVTSRLIFRCSHTSRTGLWKN